ncbi:MAG TPA: hypothetical protein VMU43_11630 [Candidatus Acidoferrum sp.]|nr:hypothetical protein [Candidatus Acidoferrum sp.]
MKLTTRALVTAFAASALLAPFSMPVHAAPADRYLHVRVEDGTDGSDVNVNIPLSMAEKIPPAIHNGQLSEGRVAISGKDLNDVDIQTILKAIHDAPDNEFVSIKQADQDVRVLKSNGNILVKIRDSRGKEADKVDVTIPLSVADALFSTYHQNQLDVAAALRALDQAGQTLAITVEEASQHVRVWVDEKNSQ